MKRIVTALALTIALAAQTFAAAAPSSTNKTNSIMLRSPIASVLVPNRSPLITFRILFNTGAAFDPQGKEGVAALTAALLTEGGSRLMSHEQMIEAMYPIATSVNWQVDKEMTVFSGTTHVDNLDKYYGLVRQMLLDPGFREADFNRVKEDALNFFKVNLRQSNDEELGKEQLYNIIYAGTPYGHHNLGTVSSLQKLTLADVKDFYAKNYTQANLVLGLAGGYPSDFVKKVEADFSKLPAGKASKLDLGKISFAPGMRVQIIKRDTRSTAFSLGFPLPVTRSDKDFAALALVASYFGQHRSSNSYLYQRLRESRGLNYGDYSYNEYFPRGMYQFQPDANLARSSQIFQIWLRPVEPTNGPFIFRAALYEYDKLVRDGLSKEAFEATREFLSKYNNILTATQDAQLGYALDSRYYKTGDYVSTMRDQLAKLTLADVNNAIKKYMKSGDLRVVIVTKDAEAFRDTILAGKPTPITYVSPKPKEITDEDKLIEAYTINLKPEQVEIVPVERVFE